MRLIKLTRGFWTAVSNRDYARLSQFKWHLLAPANLKWAYATRLDDEGKRILMHRVIKGARVGQFVDHKRGTFLFGNVLNNQRSNLRIATRSQNGYNRGLQPNNTSGFKGVSWHKASGKFSARITVNRQVFNLGLFFTAEQAAKAYDFAARNKHRNFAKPNCQLLRRKALFNY